MEGTPLFPTSSKRKNTHANFAYLVGTATTASGSTTQSKRVSVIRVPRLGMSLFQMKGRNLIFWGWRFGILVHNNLLYLHAFWLIRYLYKFSCNLCLYFLVEDKRLYAYIVFIIATYYGV